MTNETIDRSSAPRGGRSERSGDLPPRGADPDPEVLARATRRRFDAEYKARIVREADACESPGEVGALLRREALYSSHLAGWRNYFHLYVILDIFSRKVVGWMIAHRESAALARKLIASTIAKEGVPPGQLTVHADNGSSMISKDVAFLLADLGVTKTHSRPHVSNDNPFSEAQFKTLKYRPDFPERFGSIEDARNFCVHFFEWYNNHHHHSGIGWMTPADVHHGRTQLVREKRAITLDRAYLHHPERFVRRPPTPPALPTAVWINPPAANTSALLH